MSKIIIAALLFVSLQSCKAMPCETAGEILPDEGRQFWVCTQTVSGKVWMRVPRGTL